MEARSSDKKPKPQLGDVCMLSMGVSKLFLLILQALRGHLRSLSCVLVIHSGHLTKSGHRLDLVCKPQFADPQFGGQHA